MNTPISVIRLLLLALLLLPVTVAADPQSQEGLDRVTLQLKWKHQFQFAGYYAAIERGYYREAGLEVILREPEVGEEPAQVVIDGQAEFGIATSDLVLLRSRGEPVVVLAPVFQHSPLVFLVVEGRGIDSVHDLSGRRIMLEPHAMELVVYLQDEGVSLEALELLPHTFDPNDLIDGRVDAISAYVTDEPFLVREAGLGYRLFSPRTGSIDFYGDTLFTTEVQIRRHPKRVQDFVEATRRGWEYALANPQEIIDLILEKYSQRHSREHLLFEARNTRRLILPDIVEIGHSNPGRWRHIADTYARLGLMPPGISLEGFLYNEEDPQLPRSVVFAMAMAMATSALFAIIIVWLVRLNVALNREMRDRQAAEASVREREQRLRLLTENMTDVVWTMDENLRFTYVSPSVQRLRGYTPEEAMGQSMAEAVMPPSLVVIKTNMSRVFDMAAHGKVHGPVDSRTEVEQPCRNGTTVWTEANVRMFFDEHGRFHGMQGVTRDISERKRLQDELMTLAVTDPLTGINNRRRFFAQLNEELERMRRNGRSFSLLVLDLDNFKRINDRYGHPAGDAVMIHFTRVVTSKLRCIDVAGRIGGEEFAVILPETQLMGARQVAEKLREAVEEEGVQWAGQCIKFTVSIGIAEAAAEDSAEGLFARTDRVLYQAKTAGRNQVRVATLDSA